MQTISLHRAELDAIIKWTDKYPDSDYITIDVDSSSGIGSIVQVSLVSVLNGDLVKVTKTITDEDSF